MRKPVPTFVAGLIVSVLAAGVLTAQDRVDLAMVAKIRAEATERSKVLETFNYITNVAGARPTGGRAHKLAADYVRAIFNESRQVGKLCLEQRLLNVGLELVARRNAFPKSRLERESSIRLSWRNT